MTNKFKIDNIPYKREGRRTLHYPLQKMQIGQSFCAKTCPSEKAQGALSSVSHARTVLCKQYGLNPREFIVSKRKKQNNITEIRVYRVALKNKENNNKKEKQDAIY